MLLPVPPSTSEEEDRYHSDNPRLPQGEQVPSPFSPTLEGSQAGFANELHSPHFQAIFRAVGGHNHMARNGDLNSFSHELNPKGLHPYFIWKSCTSGHMEEVMARLKEDVDSDLRAFNSGLVGVESLHTHPEWEGSCEDLLMVVHKCAKMSPAEFWAECEGIVQGLDDRRQELPSGTLKQAHTHLIFIMTRCTRLVRFHKANGNEDELIGSGAINDLSGNLLGFFRTIANMSYSEYSSMEFMLDRMDDLKYPTQDSKVDALITKKFTRQFQMILRKDTYARSCRQVVASSTDSTDNESSSGDEDSSTVENSDTRLKKNRSPIEDFVMITPLSRGAYGQVFLARKKETDELFAIKVLKKADMIRKNAIESILFERTLLRPVFSPFVVQFIHSFKSSENLYLVTEYLSGGDLYSLLRNLGCLDDDMARIYIAEIVLAVERLHSLNVIHRDLKPGNLLIGEDGHIKLTDLGLSNAGLIYSTDDFLGPSVSNAAFFGDDKPKSPLAMIREQRRKNSVFGTPDYLAPEILLGTRHGATADWWSVGVILFELLVGVPPFHADHPQKIFGNIMNRNIPWPKVPDELSYEAYDLIDRLLNHNPDQRLGATGAEEVMEHCFFRNINWDKLAKQKAMFIPSTEPHDPSYFMSRYIWGLEDGQLRGGSALDVYSTGSVSCSNTQEEGDKCGNLADFESPALTVKYSFGNLSLKKNQIRHLLWNGWNIYHE